MFIKYIKDFLIKRIIKNKIKEVSISNLPNNIKTVGILIDYNYWDKKDALVQKIVANGINENNIFILMYKDTINSKDTFTVPIFSRKDISYTGQLLPDYLVNFTQKPLDLLINYYTIATPALVLVTNVSKARFKVGFSGIDKRLYHLIINTDGKNCKVFIDELFKYLRILKKI